MEQSEYKFFLQEILNSCEALKDYYKKGIRLPRISLKTRKAIEREIEIIGQAIHFLNKDYPDIEIRNKGKIMNLRKKMYYSFKEIDYHLIFKYTAFDLSYLEYDIKKLLDKIRTIKRIIINYFT